MSQLGPAPLERYRRSLDQLARAEGGHPARVADVLEIAQPRCPSERHRGSSSEARAVMSGTSTATNTSTS